MNWFKTLSVAGTFFLAALILGGYAFLNTPNQMTEETALVISRGSDTDKVASQLQKAGVIKHPLLFKIVARLKGIDKNLKAGEYLFLPHISILDTLNTINRGEVHYRKITFPEGSTTYKILKMIEQEPNLTGKITIFPKEGELLPETYSFTKDESKDSIILRAKNAMDESLRQAWQQNTSKVLKTPKQLLILASIIEKETSLSEERADIAAVFINRLTTGMKLQTDPSVIYALTKGKKDLDRKLYKKDLSIDSPYNTYKYYGLPPEPICNPGKAALMAAANPSDAQYLYFVASGNGGHRFAQTLKEHNKNVSLYRKKIKKK